MAGIVIFFIALGIAALQNLDGSRQTRQWLRPFLLSLTLLFLLALIGLLGALRSQSDLDLPLAAASVALDVFWAFAGSVIGREIALKRSEKT